MASYKKRSINIKRQDLLPIQMSTWMLQENHYQLFQKSPTMTYKKKVVQRMLKQKTKRRKIRRKRKKTKKLKQKVLMISTEMKLIQTKRRKTRRRKIRRIRNIKIKK